jgi:hypothetical protein
MFYHYLNHWESFQLNGFLFVAKSENMILQIYNYIFDLFEMEEQKKEEHVLSINVTC